MNRWPRPASSVSVPPRAVAGDPQLFERTADVGVPGPQSLGSHVGTSTTCPACVERFRAPCRRRVLRSGPTLDAVSGIHDGLRDALEGRREGSIAVMQTNGEASTMNVRVCGPENSTLPAVESRGRARERGCVDLSDKQGRKHP